MECCNKTSLSDYLLSESVAHGKRRHDYRKFPANPEKDNVAAWLDANGFRFVGTWSPYNQSILQHHSGLRYIFGPWDADEGSKWIAVRGERLGMTIRLGKHILGKHNGKFIRSTFYTRNHREVETEPDFSDMDKLLKLIKDTVE